MKLINLRKNIPITSKEFLKKAILKSPAQILTLGTA
jgi:hypothetical protein